MTASKVAIAEARPEGVFTWPRSLGLEEFAGASLDERASRLRPQTLYDYRFLRI